MQISMIGIDHSKAPLKYRERFSCTRKMAQRAAISVKEGYGLSGCILISTCNRTELWIAENEKKYKNLIKPSEMLEDIFCSLRGVKKGDYLPYFSIRHGEKAVEHIIKVACGLNSKIFGEDQIISQVRDALELGREAKTMGVELDRLFQVATAAGKDVKTRLSFKIVKQSAAESILAKLRSEGLNIKGIKCLVIGNGKMGKLVASALVNAGADVSMTLRKKMHQDDEKRSIMPSGCKMLPYDDRISQLPKNQVIISATISPHYTITKKQFLENPNCIEADFKENKDGNKIRYFFDLAVPRDIEESIGNYENVNLYNIDTMQGITLEEENAGIILEAEKIIENYVSEFVDWLDFREILPEVRETISLVEADFRKRLAHIVKCENLEHAQIEKIAHAGDKVIEKIVFETLKELDEKDRVVSLNALKKAGLKKSLRH
ncbi:MAG: glutamyl-tRNA reductase [Eubacteriales bacterium]